MSDALVIEPLDDWRARDVRKDILPPEEFTEFFKGLFWELSRERYFRQQAANKSNEV